MEHTYSHRSSPSWAHYTKPSQPEEAPTNASSSPYTQTAHYDDDYGDDGVVENVVFFDCEIYFFERPNYDDYGFCYDSYFCCDFLYCCVQSWHFHSCDHDVLNVFYYDCRSDCDYYDFDCDCD